MLWGKKLMTHRHTFVEMEKIFRSKSCKFV